MFNAGLTQVSCTAVDIHNVPTIAECDFEVEVENTPPIIHCCLAPGICLPLNDTGNHEAIVPFYVTVSDADDSTVDVRCTYQGATSGSTTIDFINLMPSSPQTITVSGTSFNVGANAISCNAVDSYGVPAAKSCDIAFVVHPALPMCLSSVATLVTPITISNNEVAVDITVSWSNIDSTVVLAVCNYKTTSPSNVVSTGMITTTLCTSVAGTPETGTCTFHDSFGLGATDITSCVLTNAAGLKSPATCLCNTDFSVTVDFSDAHGQCTPPTPPCTHPSCPSGCGGYMRP